MHDDLNDSANLISQWIVEQIEKNGLVLMDKVQKGDYDFTDVKLSFNEEMYQATALELMFMILHMVDMFLYIKDITNDRNTLMSMVLESLSDKLQFNLDDNFMEVYNYHQQTYGQYKFFIAGKEQSVKDGLFWNFGKSISNAIAGHSHNIPLVLSVQHLFVEIWKDLNNLKATL